MEEEPNEKSPAEQLATYTNLNKTLGESYILGDEAIALMRRKILQKDVEVC